MSYVIAALMASLSFLLNRRLLKVIGPVTIISLGPVIEESLKTLFAYYLNANILGVHIIFGFIEAIYDWRQGGADRAGAALLSIAGHSLFGKTTVVVQAFTDNIWCGLAAGIALHLTYNIMAVRLFSAK